MARIKQTNLKLAIHNQIKNDKALIQEGRILIENQFKIIKKIL